METRGASPHAPGTDHRVENVLPSVALARVPATTMRPEVAGTRDPSTALSAPRSPRPRGEHRDAIAERRLGAEATRERRHSPATRAVRARRSLRRAADRSE